MQGLLQVIFSIDLLNLFTVTTCSIGSTSAVRIAKWINESNLNQIVNELGQNSVDLNLIYLLNEFKYQDSKLIHLLNEYLVRFV